MEHEATYAFEIFLTSILSSSRHTILLCAIFSNFCLRIPQVVRIKCCKRCMPCSVLSIILTACNSINIHCFTKKLKSHLIFKLMKNL